MVRTDQQPADRGMARTDRACVGVAFRNKYRSKPKYPVLRMRGIPE
jgi:hypothetical protein